MFVAIFQRISRKFNLQISAGVERRSKYRAWHTHPKSGTTSRCSRCSSRRMSQLRTGKMQSFRCSFLTQGQTGIWMNHPTIEILSSPWLNRKTYIPRSAPFKLRCVVTPKYLSCFHVVILLLVQSKAFRMSQKLHSCALGGESGLLHTTRQNSRRYLQQKCE